MDLDQLDSLSVEDLARACAERASRRGHTAAMCEPDPCYELFRRALAPAPDADAWQAILEQYRRLVSCWLGQYASEDTIQDVFLRLWKAQRDVTSPFAARFPNVTAVMGYLKKCAITARFEAGREEEKRRRLWERLRDDAVVEAILTQGRSGREHAGSGLKWLVLSKLKGEQERAIFEGTYYDDLTPRGIQAARPDLFPDVRMVHRVKENLLKRLGRDRELEAYWSGSDDENAESGDDGGKTARSPVY